MDGHGHGRGLGTHRAAATYASIGWLAPLLLTLLRAVQGFAVGGEWGGASLMAVENAPAKLKAFFSSGVQVGYSVGLILATGVVALMQGAVGDASFASWGWRIPFLLSVVFVGLALWIRAGVPESQVFEELVEEDETITKRPPIVEALKRHPAAFLQIIGMRLGELFTMYIVTTFALSYAVSEYGFDEGFMLSIGLLVGGIGIITIPLFAWLSDRYGRTPVFICGAVIGVAATVPYFMSMAAGSEILVVVCSVLLVNIAHDMIVSVQQPLFTELFGAEYRYSGAGVGYQVASAIGGGFTPFIGTALVVIGGGSWHWVAAYLAGGCLISALVAVWTRTLRPGFRANPGSGAEQGAGVKVLRAQDAFLAGLIGAGITESPTPVLHEREADHHGFRYLYRILDLPTLGVQVERVGDLVRHARLLGYSGLNVTYPAKQVVIPHLDKLDAVVPRSGRSTPSSSRTTGDWSATTPMRTHSAMRSRRSWAISPPTVCSSLVPAVPVRPPHTRCLPAVYEACTSPTLTTTARPRCVGAWQSASPVSRSTRSARTGWPRSPRRSRGW